MAAAVSNQGLLPGLKDPVRDSQRLFRALLDATAHPGAIIDLSLDLVAPPPLDVATAAILLSLADFETPLWLDPGAGTGAVRDYLRFHCGCPLASRPDEAAYAIVTAPLAMPSLTVFQSGSHEYPDRGATVVIQVAAMTGGESRRFRGPGIEDSVAFGPAGLPPAFGDWLRDNHSLFPRGIDLVFTCGASLAALPRSSREA